MSKYSVDFETGVDESKEDPIEEPDNTTPILDEVVMPTGTIEEETVEPTSIIEEKEEEEVYSTSTQTEMSLEQKFDPIILDLLERDKTVVMTEINRLEVDDLTDEEQSLKREQRKLIFFYHMLNNEQTGSLQRQKHLTYHPLLCYKQVRWMNYYLG